METGNITDCPETELSAVADAASIAEDAEDHGLSNTDIRRNMTCCILLDAIFGTGMTDLMIALQPFLVFLGASNTMIGVITGVQWAALLGIFLSPWITRRFRYKKWYMFVAHLPYLGAIGVAGIGVVFYQYFGLSKHELLILTTVAFMAHYFFGGFVSLPHQEFVAAVIPMRYRGRYTGLSYSVGGVMSAVATAIGGLILYRVSKPMAFGFLFLLSWVIMQMAYVPALFAKEPPTPVEKSPAPWSKDMFRAVWRDKPFRNFTLYSMLSGLALGYGSFVPIYGFKALHMVAATAAVIQMINQVIRIVCGGPAGFIVDKLTPKRVLPYMPLGNALAILPVLFIHNQYGVYLWAAIMAATSVVTVSMYNALVYGLPSPENRAGHFAAQLIFFYAFGSLSAIMWGKVYDLLPYRTVFMIGPVLSLIMFVYGKWVASTLSDDVKAYG